MLKRTVRIAGSARRLGCRLVLGCIFCTVVAATPLYAQPADWHFRFDLFQMLFEQNGLRPIQDQEAAFAEPARTVIVAIGDTRLFRDTNRMQQFLNSGGAVLLASDRKISFGRFFDVFDGPVLSNRDADIYQGHRDCIRVRDIDQSHPLSKGVDELVLNRSGWILESLALNPDAWHAIAKLPATTSQLSNRGKTVVGTMTSQDFIVVADHSLFTNGMMWHGDNAVFAINVGSALCKGGRDQVLFLVDDAASPSYLLGPLANELPLPMPQPDIEPNLDVQEMFDVANKVVAAVEDSDSFNELLVGRPRRMAGPYYRRALLFALSGALIAYAAYRLGSKYSKPAPLAQSQTPRKSRKPSGKRLATRSDNLTSVQRGQAAQKLAQHFCQEITSSDTKAVWARELSGQGTLRNEAIRGETSESLSRVLSVALLEKPPHYTDGMLLLLANEIVELRALVYGTSNNQSSTRVRQA